MKILSPITKNENVTKIKTINVHTIISGYRNRFKYDVNYLFGNLNTIDLYKCLETGYQFFTPLVEGDSRFYERLQQNKLYYLPWKWEHEQTMQYIQNNIQILEIGCAKGDFLENVLKDFDLKCAGIETNYQAASEARKKNLKIYEEIIQVHAEKHISQYDLVCSFQVLEHIADVKSFLDACIKCMKPNGKLLISVPNNDAVISEADSLLNKPPHHAGLWDEYSLRALASLFDIRLDCISKEPLQDYHKEFFKSTVYLNMVGRSRIMRKLVRIIFKAVGFEKYLDFVSKWVIGHTILAVYTKT